MPKPVEGREYLDCRPGTTVRDFKALIRPLEVEVLGISGDGETLSFAPVIGERSKVELFGCHRALYDSHLIHNHPLSGFLSASDFLAARDHNLASICAVLRKGGELKLSRVGSSWPPDKEFEKAYRTGIRRAAREVVGKPKDRLVVIVTQEVNRSLAKSFGTMAPQIDLE